LLLQAGCWTNKLARLAPCTPKKLALHVAHGNVGTAPTWS